MCRITGRPSGWTRRRSKWTPLRASERRGSEVSRSARCRPSASPLRARNETRLMRDDAATPGRQPAGGGEHGLGRERSQGRTSRRIPSRAMRRTKRTPLRCRRLEPRLELLRGDSAGDSRDGRTRRRCRRGAPAPGGSRSRSHTRGERARHPSALRLDLEIVAAHPDAIRPHGLRRRRPPAPRPCARRTRRRGRGRRGPSRRVPLDSEQPRWVQTSSNAR